MNYKKNSFTYLANRFMKRIIIAIDGFSSCGKSTMAKELAREIGYMYIDSGAMYRAVTLYCIQNGYINKRGVDKESLKKDMDKIHIKFSFNQQSSLETYLNGINVEHEIRDMRVSANVSPVAVLDFVRKAMVAQQQELGKQKRVVMDGRDIGTTVFPQAELKIFVTAQAEIRAQRRYDELKEKGLEASFDEILKNIKERDYIDQHREISPLRRAEDSILLDNSYMTIDDQRKWLIDKYNSAICHD